jgi:hypothetical protein
MDRRQRRVCFRSSIGEGEGEVDAGQGGAGQLRSAEKYLSVLVLVRVLHESVPRQPFFSLSLSLSCLPFGVETKGLCHVKLPALDSTHTRPIRCFFPYRQARRNEGKEFTERLRLLRRPYVHPCPPVWAKQRQSTSLAVFFTGHCSRHCDTGEETNLIFFLSIYQRRGGGVVL